MLKALRTITCRTLPPALVLALMAASLPGVHAKFFSTSQRICLISSFDCDDCPMVPAAKAAANCCTSEGCGHAPADSSSPTEPVEKAPASPCNQHSSDCPCCKVIVFTSAWAAEPVQVSSRVATVSFFEGGPVSVCVAGNWVHKLLRPPCL